MDEIFNHLITLFMDYISKEHPSQKVIYFYQYNLIIQTSYLNIMNNKS